LFAHSNKLFEYTKTATSQIDKRLLHLALVLVLYLALLLPTLAHQGISWDEQTDLEITLVYVNSPFGWLTGSDSDPSQTRLPMLAVALIFGLFNTTSLIAARLVSVGFGLFTLLGIYIFCRRRFNHRIGILACLLLASSPFYLSFARVAFTESDIFVACAFAWLLVCVDYLQERITVGWAAVTGLVLGLAISGKFTAITILPAVWVVLFLGRRTAWVRHPTGYAPDSWSTSIYFVIMWIVFLTIGGWHFIGAATGSPETWSPLLTHYLLVAAGWLLIAAWAVINRGKTASSFSLALLITSLALLTFLIFPPEHIGNPRILNSLLDRYNNEMSYNPWFMLEASALHIFSILFKSGPLIGLWLLLSLPLTFMQWRQPAVYFPVLVILLYFGALMLLPLAQTFYTIPILPLLAIFAAHQFFRLAARWRTAALALAVLSSLLWAADMALSYPDYNLNGYQWVGARQLGGRSSIGYRSVVQTPSDGVEQAYQWLNQHARPGERVLSYVMEWHIIQAAAPSPVYRIRAGSDGPGSPPPEYVVVSVNMMIPQSWWTSTEGKEIIHPPYDTHWLETNYERVFTVTRRFGIEMSSVWRKK
jgi:hypothetical protein